MRRALARVVGLGLSVLGFPWFLASAAETGHVPKWPELLVAQDGKQQVAPNRECDWIYAGLEPFRSAARHPGFEARFDPHIVVSRRGLTARVVGTISDDFIERHGGSVEAVRRRFPWITPIRQTAIHEVRAEDAHIAARRREPRGEIVATQVVTLPPGSVMVVYPVSVANRARGYNTLAGNWRLTDKIVAKATNQIGRFGRFPFLLYTGSNGHALHGPITDNEIAWELKRGEVSHGCNRMEGEHVLELAVLLGCTATAERRSCPRPRAGSLDAEAVTVMEEFDHVPDPGRSVPEGPVLSWDAIAEGWIGIDVDYPREQPVPASLRAEERGQDGFRLTATRIDGRTARAQAGQQPFVRRVSLPTWDNREQRLVSAVRCR